MANNKGVKPKAMSLVINFGWIATILRLNKTKIWKQSFCVVLYALSC